MTKPDMARITPEEWREWWKMEQRRTHLRTLKKIRKEAAERAALKEARS